MPFSAVFNYLEQASRADLDKKVIEAAKRNIIDTVGVMIAGSEVSPLPDITKIAQPGGGNSSIIQVGTGYPAPTAAFFNATAAHVLDMDDYGLSMGHPSAILVPSLLSLGEQLNVSGEKLVKAYAAAIAVGYSICKQTYYRIHSKGWHGMSVQAPFVSAFGCGCLMNFDYEKFHKAMTVAVSFAGGIRGNFGTPVKPIHAGVAARNAVLAALLVNSGVAGSDAAINGKESFMTLFCQQLWTDDDTKAMEDILKGPHPLVDPALIMKLFPSCSSNHHATFAFMDILKEHPEITPDLIESIDVYLNRWAYSELVTPKPKTGVQARFSPGFHFALILNKQAVSPRNFSTEMVLRPEVQNIIDRTELHYDPTYDDYYPWPAHVTVKTKDGKSYTQLRFHADGEGVTPLTEEQLKGKFFNCAAPVLGEDRCSELYNKLTKLETIRSVAEITNLWVKKA